MYLVAIIMQGILLVWCLVRKNNQRNLGNDDFGRPLDESSSSRAEEDCSSVEESTVVSNGRVLYEAEEVTPLLKPIDKVTRKGGLLG